MKSRWTLAGTSLLFVRSAMILLLAFGWEVAEHQTAVGETPSKTAPSGKIDYSSGYLATPISIPDDPLFSGITNITVECPELTDRGAPASISFRNSKAEFNDFGDAKVTQKRETRQFDVTLKPISAFDESKEGRHVYNLVFPDDQWKNRIYFVWSPGTITSSRLLIRSGDGQLPDLVIKTGRRAFENAIGLAYILPSAKQIPEKERPAGEDLPDELSLRSYHFQSRDVSRPEASRQGYITIYGKLEGPLMLTRDLNQTSFTPFGDGASSTMVAFGQLEFKANETPAKDPAGLGRRLFQLEYQGRNLFAQRGDDSWRPPFSYTLVLAPRIDGPHRLIIRQQDQIRHVLPLYDPNWRRHLQKQTDLAQTTQEEQEAIAEMRRRFGNRLSFKVQEGHVTNVSFQRLEKVGATLAQLEQLPHLKHLHFGQCRDLTAEELQPLAKLSQLEGVSFYITPISDAVIAHIAQLKNLKYLRIYDETYRGESPRNVAHISDAGLESLAQLVNMKDLSVCGPGVTDAGIQHLAKLRGLERLYFHATDITQDGLKQLAQRLPDTKIQTEPTPAK